MNTKDFGRALSLAAAIAGLSFTAQPAGAVVMKLTHSVIVTEVDEDSLFTGARPYAGQPITFTVIYDTAKGSYHYSPLDSVFSEGQLLSTATSNPVISATYAFGDVIYDMTANSTFELSAHYDVDFNVAVFGLTLKGRAPDGSNRSYDLSLNGSTRLANGQPVPTDFVTAFSSATVESGYFNYANQDVPRDQAYGFVRFGNSLTRTPGELRIEAVDQTAAVPEPATWALMISGFGLAGGALRQRRRALA